MMRYVQHTKPLVHLRDTIGAFDALIAELRKRRTTFTEREILEPLWNEGQDARLREDERFWQLEGGQWHLAGQKLANDVLYQRLQNGEWDGNALDQELLQLDNEFGGFHVFCPLDMRLMFEAGTWRPANAERLPILDADQIALLDTHEENLLEEWRVQANGAPWQTLQIVSCLKVLGWEPVNMPESEVVTAWLLQHRDWARVSRDLWQPCSALPFALKLESPRVIPIVPNALTQPPDLTQDDIAAAENPPVDQADESQLPPAAPVTRDDQLSATWHETLRTIHLVNGYLPVPPDARYLYPNAHGIEAFCVLRGIWYEDASSFPVWLDKNEHRFFGQALAERTGFLETGAVLQIHWDASGILLQVKGLDERVNQEEERLADPAALAQLREGIGESYRQSLRTLLELHPEGMTFVELYRALNMRQQHVAHRGSIQAILIISPEFTREGRVWKFDVQRSNPSVLRRAIVLDHVSRDKPLTELVQQVKSQLAKMVAQ